MLAQLAEVGFDRWPAFQRQRADHAGDPRFACRQLRDPRRLVELLSLVDINFDEYEPIDNNGRCRLPQMLRQHEPSQLLRIAHPGIAKARRIAEMHMTVDDREIQHDLILW